MTDTHQNHICSDCIGDKYLSDLVEQEGEEKKCTYCENDGKCITMEEFADHVERAFEEHYRRTPIDPEGIDYHLQKEGLWEREGDPVVDAIAEAAVIDETPAKDVQSILQQRHSDFEMDQMGEETEFDDDSMYEQRGANDIEFREDWRLFEASLKTKTRHFNKEAEGTLKATFEGVADLATHDGKKVVVEAGPGKEVSAIYRARVFQKREPLVEAMKRPDVGIGPPPPHAANAGRMNARGISLFYGALDPKIALAEIRPPVGSSVMVGKFELTRTVKLLAVAALNKVYVEGSVFDLGHIRELERARFLGHLSERITRPVMPDDEASDYLPTQAMADYLASELGLDGIIYPSAQGGGEATNVVLFHAAARVEPMSIPPEAKMQVSTELGGEDGPEPYYSVSEVLPEKPTEEKKPDASDFPEFPSFIEMQREREADQRITTLKIMPDSVKVHEVRAVEFKTDDHTVTRHRYTHDQWNMF